MSAVAVQRPLDVGRALDAALAVYRRHFVAIVAAMAVAVVPLELLTLAPRPWGVIGNVLQLILLGGVTPGVATLVVADVRAGAARLRRTSAPACAHARRARPVGHPRADRRRRIDGAWSCRSCF